MVLHSIIHENLVQDTGSGADSTEDALIEVAEDTILGSAQHLGRFVQDDELTHLCTLILDSNNNEALTDREKPVDWDHPEHIHDEDVKKPDDGNDKIGGEWEPSVKRKRKGRMKTPTIREWIHPEIHWTPDDTLDLHGSWETIGLDLWQVKAGTIFDNVLVADSIEDLKEHKEETFEKLREAEKGKKEARDKKEPKRKEEEEKKRGSEGK